MALTTKLPLLMVFVLLFSFYMIPPSECTTTGPAWLNNKASTLELHNRKFLQMLSDLKSRKRVVSDKYEDMVEWDLRKVPSGPDPLHHNGGSPKKPRTP